MVSEEKKPKAEMAGNLEQVSLVRTSVLCNGELATYRPGNRCHIPTKASPNSLPSDLGDVSDQLYALNDLQLKRDQPIDPLSLRFALESLFLSLPREAQRKIMISSGTLTDALFGDNDHDLFRSLLDRLYAAAPKHKGEEHEEQRSYWKRVRQHEYFIWPVLAGPEDWVTLVMQLGCSSGSDALDTVTHFAVVDASGGVATERRVERVTGRIQELFAHGNITFERGALRKMWVPSQSDSSAWESGIRSFQLVRQLLQRITDSVCAGTSLDADRFFATPTSGWLNVDFIRHEMIGMVQENCNSVLDYACRYALEPILEIRLEAGGIFPPNCLGPIDDGKAICNGDMAGTSGDDEENETQAHPEHLGEEARVGVEASNGNERCADDDAEMDDMEQQAGTDSNAVSREDAGWTVADEAGASSAQASQALPSLPPSGTTSPKRPLQEVGSEPEARQPRLE